MREKERERKKKKKFGKEREKFRGHPIFGLSSLSAALFLILITGNNAFPFCMRV